MASTGTRFIEGTTAQQSTHRLVDIVERMQRLTNLDRAEVLPADLNGLLRDVTTMLQSQAEAKGNIELDGDELPKLQLRPQQIGAVFSNLLQNALEASGEKGTVSVTTSRSDSKVEVLVRDEAQISQEDLAAAFEPGFQVRGTRVTSGNWGLFSARQIIREHGGDIGIERLPNGGRQTKVSLPV